MTGNFHALLLFRNDEEKTIAREVEHRMVERAIRMDGTCEFYLLHDGHSTFKFLITCFLTSRHG